MQHLNVVVTDVSRVLAHRHISNYYVGLERENMWFQCSEYNPSNGYVFARTSLELCSKRRVAKHLTYSFAKWSWVILWLVAFPPLKIFSYSSSTRNFAQQIITMWTARSQWRCSVYSVLRLLLVSSNLFDWFTLNWFTFSITGCQTWNSSPCRINEDTEKKRYTHKRRERIMVPDPLNLPNPNQWFVSIPMHCTNNQNV